MINRPKYIKQIEKALKRSPVVAILGPRQCGKTTLARQFSSGRKTFFFDLESSVDDFRLQNPEMALGELTGLIVLDEIQRKPELFNVLRILADRPGKHAKFLILGSASPGIVRYASESLAGRVEFIEVSGFELSETGVMDEKKLWMRGGFPRSFLSKSNENSVKWRENFIQTFLERDLPSLGLKIPAVAMRKFWTMLAHYHGQIWSASDLSRSLGLSDHTIKRYLDLLTGTFMIRQLQPWYENISKRQVKSPKIYFRDSGIFHSFLSIYDKNALMSHPKVGASWEGFAIEETMRALKPADAYFWASHTGAELDLMIISNGKKYGFEYKFSETPKATRSMQIAIEDLNLSHLWIVYPGKQSVKIDKQITVLPLSDLSSIPIAGRTL
ncbi:MAG: ATP-binding protein [Candidatus Riflebacteria bacterium]|nr:ATP-binding protein [Candidatus Riflebacteria bacterium]